MAKGISGDAGALGEAAAGDLVSAVLDSADVVVPGLGIILHIIKGGTDRWRDRESAEAIAVATAEATAARGVDLVQDLAPAIGQVARNVVPIVIFVEDLHRGDDSLIELLARLLSENNSRVLVITTAWPGSVEEEARPSHRLADRVPADRRRQYSTVSGNGGHSNDDVGPLSELDDADLRRLSNELVPKGADGLVDALAERYRNPLALQLACSSQELRLSLRGGENPHDVVTRLPQEVRELYEQAWRDLPDSTRLVCTLAVLSTPAGISKGARADKRWDQELLAAGIDADEWLQEELERLGRSSIDAGSTYAWVRSVSRWLRSFHESVQFHIANDRASNLFKDPASQLAGFFAGVAGQVLSGGVDDDRAVYQARLVVCLGAEGYIVPNEFWYSAAERLCTWLESQPDTSSAHELIDIADLAISHNPAAERLPCFRRFRAAALGRLGMVAETVAAFELLVDEQARVLGHATRATLTTEADLACWRGLAGDAAAAITGLREVIATQTERFGEDDPDTLTTRAQLASWLGTGVSADAAVSELELLVTARTARLGATARATHTSRNDLAYWLGEAGRWDEAVAEFEKLKADRIELLGHDTAGVFNIRNNLASLLGRAGQVERALAEFEELAADRERVLGPDAADTFASRRNVASWQGRAGHVDRALATFEQLIRDRTRVLGPDAPDTLTTRRERAFWLAKAPGRIEDALTEYEQLVIDQGRVLGTDAPDTRSTISDLENLRRATTQSTDSV